MECFEDFITPVIADLDEQEVPRRIWERDHTVWKPTPDEISNRLGWLGVAGDMRRQALSLQAFAEEVNSSGIRHVAVLGMGGSSLGALTLQQLFGSAKGYPELIVLDTTIPDTIREVSQSIDCSKTLFIVASKSGTTIEPNVLYRFFRSHLEGEFGAKDTGSQFVAICDAGTELEQLASEHGFRRTFTNPADIGGRYSVQSLFGLVPAALIGVDIARLLDRVEAMSDACGPDVPAEENPGARLGAIIAACGATGRDKLTVITTESLAGFGLWVEQLLAESTGKEGRGIVPVSGEPEISPDALGSDRLFVYVRLDGDNADETDAYIGRVEAAGVPTVRIALTDKHEIGGEFFRWEFATAVAGSILSINPFDQPDVQRAKDNTSRLLDQYRKSGVEPALDPSSSLADLIAQSKAGDYLAITAYAKATPQLERAVALLRERVTQISGIATTLGYGPRYLHSTGQLHKGGSDSGMFLQLTQMDDTDVTIPGEEFTFGILAAAQAKGDLDALTALGRRVARVNLQTDAAQAIDDLVRSLD